MTMPIFTLYCANCRENETNCLYPHKIEVSDKESLIRAVSKDYVCAEYKNSYRNTENFISGNCCAVDCDNTHSDDPKEWITPKDVAASFPDVPFFVHYSRHHMKAKNGKAARPKFHIGFFTDTITDSELLKRLKERAHEVFPYFDPKAMDSAHFFYGTENPQVEFFPGTKTLNEFLGDDDEFDADMPQGNYGKKLVIEEGRRNATMSRFAGKLVKRYGSTEKAFQIFMEEADRCNPPLSDEELGKVWASAQRFAKKVQGQPGYVPPEKYRPDTTMQPSDYSDVGQAKVLARDCANELAFSPGTDFIVYETNRWVESKSKAMGVMLNFLDRQLSEAREKAETAEKELIKSGLPEEALAAGGKVLKKAIQNFTQADAYLKYNNAITYRSFACQRRDIKYVNGALTAVKPLVEVSISAIDSHPFLLNCPDGTYDLTRGLAGRREHDPADLITQITAYAPGDKGKDLWLGFVDSVCESNRETIEYLQMCSGLSLIGEVYHEGIFIAFGVGRNGKSTWANTVAGAMGSYAGVISADVLTTECRRNTKPELAELKGKRFLIASELEEGKRMSTAMVKQLSSTDEIEGEKKYKAPFKFKPSHTLILCTNHLPKVGAMDDGIWRRLVVIPFTAKFEGNNEIKNYSKYLLDNAGPYIMKWLIEGAEKIISNRFVLTPPACVRDAVAKYKAENDWMTHFLDDCCDIGKEFEEKSGELYTEYRAYCLRNGEFTRSTAEFYKCLEERGFVRQRYSRGVFVRGLKLSVQDF